MPTQMDELFAEKQKKKLAAAEKKLDEAKDTIKALREDKKEIRKKEADKRKKVRAAAKEKIAKAQEERKGLTKGQLQKIHRAEAIIKRRRKARESRSAAMKSSAKARASRAASKTKMMAGLKRYWLANLNDGYVVSTGKLNSYLRNIGIPADFVNSHSLKGNESAEDLTRIKKKNARILRGRSGRSVVDSGDTGFGNLFD